MFCYEKIFLFIHIFVVLSIVERLTGKHLLWNKLVFALFCMQIVFLCGSLCKCTLFVKSQYKQRNNKDTGQKFYIFSRFLSYLEPKTVTKDLGDKYGYK